MGEFSAAQFRDRVDNGRKVAIQIPSSSIATGSRCGVATCGASTSTARSVSPCWRVDQRGKIRFRKRSVPGGASGLQIREGPRDGPWWVRLLSFRHVREVHDDRAIAERVKLLDRERAFARGEGSSFRPICARALTYEFEMWYLFDPFRRVLDPFRDSAYRDALVSISNESHMRF